MSFCGASFDGTWLGDTAFDDCQSKGCSSTSKDLGSARRHKRGDEADGVCVFKNATFAWPGGQPPDPRTVLVQQRRSSLVKVVVVIPNGRTALTGADDNTALLWDLDRGPKIRRILFLLASRAAPPSTSRNV